MKRIFSVFLSAVSVFLILSAAVGCKNSRKEGTVYEITAEYQPETSAVAGTLKLKYVNAGDNKTDVLKFQLYPNAYREDALYKPLSATHSGAAYYAGKSYGGMEISEVRGAKNWEITGEDKNILSVYLKEPLYPDDKVTLEISFVTKLAKVNHRTGIAEKSVNLGNFYPVLCPPKSVACADVKDEKSDGGGDGEEFYECVYYSDGDPFVSECADKYTVKFIFPEKYTLAATGKVIFEKKSNGKKEYTVSATNVRDFAAVLSDSFEVAECETKGIRIKYYYYNDDRPAAHLAVAKEAIDYFSDNFGKYPYGVYSVAQTGLCYGGIEYPALTMVSDALSEDMQVQTIVHETAHQWWYAAVGSNQAENAWQDEGLAEYSSMMFFDKHSSYGHTMDAMIDSALKEYHAYYDVYSRVFGKADTRMTRKLKEYLSEYEYRSIAYDKGAIMFDTLRTAIGDKKFAAGLKEYYKEYRFRLASPADLIGCFEKSGVDVAGFFRSFLEGKAII